MYCKYIHHCNERVFKNIALIKVDKYIYTYIFTNAVRQYIYFIVKLTSYIHIHTHTYPDVA